MDQVFTREHILRSVANSLMAVSKDLYNLELDELSEVAINFGIACFDQIDEKREETVLVRRLDGSIDDKMKELGEKLIRPYEPKNVGVETDVKPLGEHVCQCKVEECGTPTVDISKQCNGHVNPGDLSQSDGGKLPPKSTTNIESEVTEIVAKIRSKM